MLFYIYYYYYYDIYRDVENERSPACEITFVHRQSDRDHARDDVVKK